MPYRPTWLNSRGKGAFPRTGTQAHELFQLTQCVRSIHRPPLASRRLTDFDHLCELPEAETASLRVPAASTQSSTPSQSSDGGYDGHSRRTSQDSSSRSGSISTRFSDISSQPSKGRKTSTKPSVTMASLEPAAGLSIRITSSVAAQYGRQIRLCAQETLERLGVTDAAVTIVDKGALDCTLRARLECAVERARGASPDRAYPWGGARHE